MINLFDISLLDIMPDSLKQDPDMVAMAKAFTPEIQTLSQETLLCLLESQIEHVSSDLIDHLAYERHVDFYDAELPLEVRRLLVKNSLAWHRHKGTPWAVEQLVSTVFQNSVVREWFEYEGLPHHFRIETEQLEFRTGELAKFRRLIESVKRKSSWLDDIVFKIKAGTIRVGISVQNFSVDYLVCNTFYPNEDGEIVVSAPTTPVFVTPGMPMFTAIDE
ncbi:phage tail protein I [Brevibacillus reuszeri]|uniref:phage tail protein I n=1 Tax=Brevibacillus reuszeri TaxID=54915 RepID=UPI0028A15BAD|nr:phage tail protein I [Brevibacillus reuszeri]